MKAIISVDVEECPEHNSFCGLKELLKILEKNKNFTLFATPEAIKKLGRLKNHELGLHLHPNKKNHEKDFLSKHYNKDDLIKKAITKLGKPVKSFRAGNWSYSEDLPLILKKNGFTHDSSKLPDMKTKNKIIRKEIIQVKPSLWGNRIINFLTQRVFGKPFFLCEGVLRRPLGEFFFRKAVESLNEQEIIMFTFHSYDLENGKLRNKVINAIKLIKKKRMIVALRSV